jgi:hypothetical protein
MRCRVVVGGVITDPERTALDLFARPEIFGRAVALELLEENLARLDLARLVEYALRRGRTHQASRLEPGADGRS